MAPQSSTLAWKIPWMEEPGGLQSLGLLRVGHDWATSLSLFTFMHWRRKWQPTPVFLPEESRDREPGGLPSMGSHRVGHDWSDLAGLCVNGCEGRVCLFVCEGFPRGASGKEPACQNRRQKRCGYDPWVWMIPWRRKWQPTPVFLPGKFHGQKRLMGYSPFGPKESDTTEVT